VTRQAVCLRPSTEPVTKFEDCAEPAQPFTEPAYNPALREVVYRLDLGQRLAPDTVYRLTVFVQDNPELSGIFAFDGAPLVRSFAFDFRTQPAGSPAFDEPSPNPQQFCDAIACVTACNGVTACIRGCRADCVEPDCFNQASLNRPSFLFSSCASIGCHGPATPTSDPDFSVVAAGLDLYNEAGVLATAVGRTAHQTQQGQASTTPDQSPVRFGRAMPLIDPSNPGNSYLLYKLIINPLNHWRPGGTLDPSLEAELNRLRASVVVGLPMPTENGAFFGLTHPFDTVLEDPEGFEALAQMQLISAWIASGATFCQ
jgi:hypothetical protein